MELTITQVPFWLSLAFILSFSIPVWLVARTAQKAYQKVGKTTDQSKRLYRRVIVFYIGFLGLVANFALSGFFAKNTLPPRILLGAALPLLLFYFLYVWRSNWFKTVYENSDLADLISIHFFRFIGIFFFLTHYYGALPKTFAWIGGLGDILTATLAIPVVFALKKKRPYARLLVWVWSIVGLADILSVLRTAVVITQESIANNTVGVAQFGTFPFAWIPAFAPATILFLHAVILVKLVRRK